jgi:hypothetical protein
LSEYTERAISHNRLYAPGFGGPRSPKKNGTQIFTDKHRKSYLSQRRRGAEKKGIKKNEGFCFQTSIDFTLSVLYRLCERYGF